MKESKIYVLGSINIDLNIEVDYIPKNGETIKGFNYLRNIGGKGFNQANALTTLGNQIVFISAIGNDDFGDYALNIAKRRNININNILTKDTSTGIAMIIRNKNDNRIIINGGANDQITTTDIEILKSANSGDILVSQFEVPQDVVEQSFIYAKNNGMTTILNPAPAQMLSETLYKYTDYLILNETETEIITDIYPDSKEKIKEASNIIIKRGIPNVVITLGGAGSSFANKNEFFIENSFSGNVIDTTGAGDSFVGGFVNALKMNLEPKLLLTYGNASGIYTCEINGVEDSMPTKSDVERIIKGGKKIE